MSGPMLLLGTAFKVFGAISQANSERRAAETNAAIARRNEVIARNEAAADEAKQRRAARKRLALIAANNAGSGFTGDGSVLDIIEDSAKEEELEALTIRYRGDIKAQGFAEQALIEDERASNAKKKGFINAGAALLSGGNDYFALKNGAG